MIFSPVAFFPSWIVILVALIATALLWGLTVEVNKNVVRLHFGIGIGIGIGIIIHRNILRKDIAMVTQVRYRWWWGFGGSDWQQR